MHHTYMLYWKSLTARYCVDEQILLNHTGSEQLYKVEPGDTLWIVTVMDGVLYTIGSIEVDVVTNQMDASVRLKTTDLWEADYHAIARRGTASISQFCPVPLSVVMDLRFESRFAPALTVRDGKVSAQQLRAMRELTVHSAELLVGVWEDFIGRHERKPRLSAVG